MIIRYTDDIVCAFQHKQDAELFPRSAEAVFDSGTENNGKVPKQAAETLCLTFASAQENRFEEPGAAIPHAGIRGGAVA
jgi:hypothetical protein